ncbi:glycoside hydrolase [Aspergillus ellipticus CBS 707.79]|uniref:beta-glucosidase n=1 Tax=Aspergillus ellipticus CBS 707.79 TaxID=1448320 RepID=A0A319D0F0_9EURO|nr:glycoside hydrolase [Aspergillus ellipticus CBS 707.79]
MATSTDINDLLTQLTFEEKVALVSGADGWQTQEIPRLGIGSLKTTDGPAGVRGKLSVGGSQAVFLPAPAAQAATWSRDDVRAIGHVLSREMETKAAQVLLAPTSFSEDPFLSGSLAIEYVAGVQEKGNAVATAKHFVANEQEHARFTINAIVDEKALREIYLRPFAMMIKGPVPPGCLMTSYNAVNGLHTDMNPHLINDILRDEWKYDGLVMSDWGGTNSTAESLLAGCDLEMPGPSDRRGQKLLNAIATDKTGALTPALNRSCHRILSLLQRTNLLGLSPSAATATRTTPETSHTSPTDIQTVRNVVANSTVLLKNTNNTLPLLPHKLHNKKVAFIGPNAQIGAAGGGGSASMNPQYQSQPMEAFKQRAPELGIHVDVEFSIGAYNHKWLPLVTPDQWTTLKLDFFDAPDCQGTLIETQYRTDSLMDLFDTAPLALQGTTKPYSFRMTSTLAPHTTGTHSFGLTSIGHSRLFVDGSLLIDNSNWTVHGESFYSFGSAEARQSLHMTANQPCEIILEASSKPPPSPSSSSEPEVQNPFSTQPSTRLGFLPHPPTNPLSAALTLAQKSDFVILILGLTSEWESEGFDRTTLSLPGSQNELVTTLLSGLPDPANLIIVNQSGSPVSMPWADDVGTILQAWFGGQEAGNALADVLLGVRGPGGKLPMSWPRRYDDLGFRRDEEVWPGVNGVVRYKEGSEVGYRWFLRRRVEPLWWFGFGLGVEMRDGVGVRLGLKVKNVGGFEGMEVVQVYCWREGRVEGRELVVFEKTGADRA